MKCKDKKTAAEVKAEQQFPGVAVDRADCDKTTPAEVKADTRALNNNPRNSDWTTNQLWTRASGLRKNCKLHELHKLIFHVNAREWFVNFD